MTIEETIGHKIWHEATHAVGQMSRSTYPKIYLVWAQRSDKQCKVVCASSSRAACDRAIKEAQAIDAKRSKIEKYFDAWEYFVIEPMTPNHAISDMQQEAKACDCIDGDGSGVVHGPPDLGHRVIK